MFACYDCGKHFRSKLDLESHEMELFHHHQMEEMGKTRHDCAVCEFANASIAEYSKHVETEGHKQQLSRMRARTDIGERRGRAYDRPPSREERPTASWDYEAQNDRRDGYGNYDRPPSRNYDRPPSGEDRAYDNYRRPAWEENGRYRDRRWEDHPQNSSHVMSPRSTARNTYSLRGRTVRNSDATNSNNIYSKSYATGSSSSRNTANNRSGAYTPPPNDPPAVRTRRTPTPAKNSVTEKPMADKAKTPASKAKSSPKKKVSLAPTQRKGWEKPLSATAIAKKSVERQQRNRMRNYRMVAEDAPDVAVPSIVPILTPPSTPSLPTTNVFPLGGAAPTHHIINVPVSKRPNRSRTPAPAAVGYPILAPMRDHVDPPMIQQFHAGGPDREAELQQTLNQVNEYIAQQQPVPTAAVAPLPYVVHNPPVLVAPVAIPPVAQAPVAPPVAPHAERARETSPLRRLHHGAVLNLIKQENPDIIELPSPVDKEREIGRLTIEENKLSKEMETAKRKYEALADEMTGIDAAMTAAVYNPALSNGGTHSDEMLRQIGLATIRFCNKRREMEDRHNEVQRLDLDIKRIALQKNLLL